MRRTKAVGIAGRFGARYGSSLRKKWKEIMEKRYAIYTCPFCNRKTRFRRLAVGIWQCPKCGRTWAGGAYTPWTEAGKAILEKGT